MIRRTACSFVVWGRVAGRSQEIASQLGGRACPCYWARLGHRRLTPLRYVLSAGLTALHLLRWRPRAVVVTNPPVFAALLVYCYASLTRARFVLDSHPSSFGCKGDTVSRRLLWLHRWLSQRAAATLVTTEEWADTVTAWGGSPEIVHEAPPVLPPPRPRPLNPRPQILFVSVFAADEPVAAVVEAARLLPDVTITITGDPRRAGALDLDMPSNVDLVGYLDRDTYRSRLCDADVVLALTTEPTSVMRAAYEAVYAGKPLVTNGWPALQVLFPSAIHVDNDPASIASGLETAIRSHSQLLVAAPRAAARQADRWAEQLARLRSRMVEPVDREPRPEVLHPVEAQ